MQPNTAQRHGEVFQAFTEANRRIDAEQEIEVFHYSFPDQSYLFRTGVHIDAFSSHAFRDGVVASHSGPKWHLWTIRYIDGEDPQFFMGPSFASPEPAIWPGYAVARSLVEYAAERLSEWPENTPPGWYDKRYEDYLSWRRATPVEQRLKLTSVRSALLSLEAEQARGTKSFGPLNP